MPATRTEAAARVSNQQEPLRALLTTLAGETGDLARSADRLQLLFGQLMRNPPVRPDDALERAQALDGLVQRLQGLEAFLTTLRSGQLGNLPKASADAAARLRLTSQASRFAPAAATREAEVATGDCDLF